MRTGKIHFCFENMWLKVDNFKELIRGWWEGYNVQGSFSHILAVKLISLKQNLKAWNREGVWKCFYQEGCCIISTWYLGCSRKGNVSLR